jgi:hypothetical protein
MADNDKRLAVRRGAEHVRVTGASEELGEIVPAPVVTEDDRVTVEREGSEDEPRRR